MKHGHAWALGLLALTLTACGGSDHHSGGSTSTSTATTGPGLTSDYRIESVLTDASLDPGYIYEDPLDIQVLDTVTFELVSYPGGTAASRTVVPTVGTPTNLATVAFSTNDSLNTAGSLTSAGLFTASGTDSGTMRYIVSATYGGQVYTAYYQTSPRLNSARVTGQVVSGGTGVYNAEVDFYGSRNSTSSRQVILATVRTGPDGTFRATVPLPSGLDTGSTADFTFTVRQPTGYPSTFNYLGTSYIDADTVRAPISLGAGETSLSGGISLGGTATPD